MLSKSFKIKTVNWYFGDLCEEMNKFLDSSYNGEKDFVSSYSWFKTDDEVLLSYFMLKYPGYIKLVE